MRRLRSFTMPDMHTLTRDIEGAKKEFIEQYKLALGWMRDTGIEYEIGGELRLLRRFGRRARCAASPGVSGRPRHR